MAILGLVPIGMKAFQDAMRLNVEAEIVQTIARELDNTPWKDPGGVGYPTLVSGFPVGLKKYVDDSFPIYFDAEGRKLGSGSTPPAGSTFAVHVQLVSAAIKDQSNNDVKVEAAGGVNLLYRAKIFIAYRKLANLPTRVSSGSVPNSEAQWIKEYPILLAYKGY